MVHGLTSIVTVPPVLCARFHQSQTIRNKDLNPMDGVSDAGKYVPPVFSRSTSDRLHPVHADVLEF